MRTLPYASPTPLAATGDLFHHGTLLIVRHNTTLPPFCILCNAPAAPDPARPVRLIFTWDPSFKVTRETTLHLRQTAAIHAFLCTFHLRAFHRSRRLAFAGILFSSLLLLASGILASISELSTVPRYTVIGISGMLIAFALLTLSMFLLAFKTKTLSCKKIDHTYLHLADAHPNFLTPLPPLPPSDH